MTYYVENEGCFLVNLKRALDGAGLEGGAWTASIRKGKKFATLREARKASGQIRGAHVYRPGLRDLLDPKDVRVGDTIENKFVGACRVEEIVPERERDVSLTHFRLRVPAGAYYWVRVSYEGTHCASGETRRFSRSDPLSVWNGEPYFRRMKKR